MKPKILKSAFKFFYDFEKKGAAIFYPKSHFSYEFFWGLHQI
jgi:hypothetical protein